jgi:uncharacterized YccA/Bax inhibitor family protein
MASSNILGRKESAVLNSRTFQETPAAEYEEAMTVRGTVNKTAILLTIVAVSAAWSWRSMTHDAGLSGLSGGLLLLVLAAFVVALITSANRRAAPFTAPLYAFLEGSVLGGISAIFEAKYPGLVIQAIFLTFGTLLGLLAVYSASSFHVTARFRTGVVSAVLAILLVYVVDLLVPLFGLAGLPFLHQGGWIEIGFSLLVVAIAALNLVLDFDIIDEGARQGAPRYMEWYAAFGLMVTLIWLYLEVLKLLIRLAASSDDN